MREGTTGRKNFIKYLRKNLTRMLLFAVILSTGFTMRLVTRTKYVSYINGFKHAQAGDFYFTSNYLTAEGSDYTVTNWARDSFDISIRIQNYENALLYNTAGQDFYYTVEAKMYTDETFKTEDTSFDVDIIYTGAQSSGTSAGTGTGTEIGTGTGTTTRNTVTIDGKKYAKFPGMSAFDTSVEKTHAVQNVDIKFTSENKVNDARYIKVTAKTLPVADMLEEGLALPSKAVYSEELAATFTLNSSTAQNISATLSQMHGSSEAIYKLKCLDTTAGAFAKVSVLYNYNKMELDDMLPYTATIVDGPGTSDGSDAKYFKKITFEMTSTSIVNLIFFKHRMSDEIYAGADLNSDIYFIKETN